MLKIVGHRGARGYEPENTLLSIRKGIECGANFVEVDVRKTRDNMLVLMHDERVDRTTNGYGLLKEMTFEELRKLDAGKGQIVPTLKEVLQFVRNKCNIILEIKEPGTEKEVLEEVIKEKMLNNVIFASFYPLALSNIKNLNRNARISLIFYKEPYKNLELAERMEVEIMAPEYHLVNESFIKSCKDRDLKVNTWTVDSEEDIRKIIKYSPFAITTDYPCLLRDILRNIEKKSL